MSGSQSSPVTIAQLPPAADNPLVLKRISDGPTGKTVAFSDGAKWRWLEGAEVPIPSISLSATAPGTRPAGAWTTSVVTQNVTSITWGVYDSAGALVGSTTTVATTGTVSIAPNFTATGQRVKAWPTNAPSLVVQSNPVTIQAPVTPTIAFSNGVPGTRPAGVWTTNIVTTGISSITWTMVDANWNWLIPAVTVATSGTVAVSPSFTASGQRLMAWDTSNTDRLIASEPVTIQAAQSADPLANTTLVWSGVNNLTHRWGHVTVSNGVMECRAIPADGYAKSGAMEMIPSGPDKGHGYGVYKLRGRFRPNPVPGPYFLLIDGSDQWHWEIDFIEVDNNGVPYSTIHHGGNVPGGDQYETHYLTGLDPTVDHTYLLVWKPGLLEMWIDGVKWWTHTTNVPIPYAQGGQNGILGPGMEAGTWALSLQNGDNWCVISEAAYYSFNS